MATITAYCMRCRRKVDVQSPVRARTGKNNIVKGTCASCGGKVVKIVG